MSVTYLSCDAYYGSICIKYDNVSVSYTTGNNQTYGTPPTSAQNIMDGIRFNKFVLNSEIGEQTPEQLCNSSKPEVISQNRGIMENLLNCNLFNYSDMTVETARISRNAFQSNLLCWYDWKGACANIRPDTFDLGTIQAVMVPYQKGVDWDIIDRSSINSTAWAHVWYMYDFVSPRYNKNSQSNGPIQLASYINKFNTGRTRIGNISMPVEITNLYYKMLLTKAIFTDFYNQIYRAGYYANTAVRNPLSKDYISTTFSSDSVGKERFISEIVLQNCSNTITNNCISADIKTIWLNNLTIPTCYVENGECYIDFDISAELYLSYTASTRTLDEFTNSLLNKFFIDDDNTVRLTVGESIVTPRIAQYEQTIFRLGMSSIYQFIIGNYIDLTNDRVVRNFVSPSVMMTIPLRTKVKQFSPTLLAYFSATYPQAVIANGLKIIADTNLIPTVYFNSLSSSAQLTYVRNNCNTNYTPSSNQPINILTFQQYMLNNSTGICLCYCSKLVPLNNPSKCGNKSAMCFDNACTDDYNALLGINNCGSSCGETCSWSESVGSNTFRNPASFNTIKFEQSCGFSCDSVLKRKTSIFIPVLGMITSILGAIIAFLLCQYNQLGKTISYIATISVLCALVGVTAFFTADFSCLPRCGGSGGKTPECMTKYTKMSVSTDFCSPNLACECQFGVAGDCGSNCTCVSTVCKPNDGSARPTVKEYNRKPNMIWILFCLLIAIMIIMISVLLYKIYTIDISLSNYIGLTVLLVITPISMMLHNIISKKESSVFESRC